MAARDFVANVGNVIDNNLVVNVGIRAGAERLVPGSNLMLSGRVVEGAAHTAAAILARAVLGPVGVLLVCVNSISRTMSGKHVHQLVTTAQRDRPEIAETSAGGTQTTAEPSTQAN